MKVERVSYDVITPSAARGIIEAIHWRPAIRWHIDKIHVINPIKFQNIRRNEVGHVIPTRNVTSAMKSSAPLFVDASDPKNRVQRASMVLRDVEYIIEAHFELTEKASGQDTAEKHYNMIMRRAKKGQCHNQPYFGTREFPAKFELLEGDVPESFYTSEAEVDFNWMLFDIDFDRDMTPMFFKAVMRHGCIELPSLKEVQGE